jgi:hypothetical protein
MMSDEVVRQYLRKDEPRGIWGTLWLCVNPFTRVDGWPALGWGVFIVAATAVVAIRAQVNFDGVMDLHVNPAFHAPAWFLAFEGVADWLIVALLFWAAGAIFARPRPRGLDFLGMLAIGRLPFLLSGILLLPSLLGKLMGPLTTILTQTAQHPDQLLQQIMTVPGIWWIMVGMAVMMALMLWGAFLNFFAVKEASGLETGPAIGVYVAGVIVAESISKIVIAMTIYRAGL